MIETSDATDRLAGITDSTWWSWFNEEINGCYDPWSDWLDAMCFPHEGPLHDWLEQDIKDVIHAADQLRLATVPQTQTFTKQWATFRKHHQDLDAGGKYCRKRYMVWRAAALTVICERDRFQDEVDAKEARDKLAKTMRWFWPSIDASGNYVDGNFWCPKLCDFSDGSQGPDPLTEYAAMVLLLMRRAWPQQVSA